MSSNKSESCEPKPGVKLLRPGSEFSKKLEEAFNDSQTRAVVLDLRDLSPAEDQECQDSVGHHGDRPPLVVAVSGSLMKGAARLVATADICIAGATVRVGSLDDLVLEPKFSSELTGSLSGQELVDLGMVNGPLLEEGELEEAVYVANRIADMAPLAVAACLKAVRSAGELPLDAGLREEARVFSELFETKDMRRGVQAFITKTKPEFRSD